ncbi:vitamin B12 dependent-methionine synthase activation domain-containing protein [Prevotella melaninogenica]|uniref:5-methyltetrahydrofolate--homocysteine methyltransferase n=1 Tax=Prevotella melaninogenica TaxID=28132 RepID=A0A7D4GD25_9BACT|nr:vitamin B12 dependent-methionine synthase activation domain-containing protein [Prevotella melaninogenica]EFC73257.1 Vitamin B12 dependent methionine synthase, activation domain protein [Prevotella melaninogenica D18]QKH89090.1 5-methyltetrahydrofolate--homocysteine methyltransferase [Prevotella melaninogenica]
MIENKVDNKSKIITYNISEIVPYINWAYFFYAWSMNGKAKDAQLKLRSEAEKLLADMEGRYHTRAVFALCEANSEGDDIIINGTRVPMLRQQKVIPGKPNLCLADFIRPASSGIKDAIGLFATSVDAAFTSNNEEDPYQRMLSQTLADRLAEATAEKFHEDVRKKYWGYAADEQLTIKDLLAERYQGIRPAVGYPSIPDTSMNFLLYELLDMKGIGINLTESGMMVPHASVSGFMFAHPQSRYFDLGKIDDDQLEDYARRRNKPVEELRKYLASTLLKK